MGVLGDDTLFDPLFKIDTEILLKRLDNKFGIIGKQFLKSDWSPDIDVNRLDDALLVLDACIACLKFEYCRINVIIDHNQLGYTGIVEVTDSHIAISDMQKKLYGASTTSFPKRSEAIGALPKAVLMVIRKMEMELPDPV